MISKIEKKIKKSFSKDHWEKIQIKHHHGIVCPIFSLRSKDSSGIGDFLDLKKMIDWCFEINFNIIQLLPLNEMSQDFSPYNGISSVALEPIYINLKSLSYIKNTKLEKELLNFDLFKKQQRVAYLEIKTKKLKWLYSYFKKYFHKYQKDAIYQKFINENDWLLEYALFHIIKDEYGGKNIKFWPKHFQKIDQKTEKKILSDNLEKVNFYRFIQFLSFSQMKEVKEYAEKKNIFLMGDVPIFISSDSHDVWLNSKLFDKSHYAGAPADDLNPYGQNWGFYLFNWEAHRKTNFKWWRRRLAIASELYHLYRIDHVIGFFRIFAILPKETALQGKFLPKNSRLWAKQGKEILTMMLKASPLLPIAEDLGFIPRSSYKILHELCIPGMRIMRWQKKGTLRLNKYPPLTMTSVSTHDTETLEEWWQRKKEVKKLLKQKKWQYNKKLSQEKRLDILKDSHSTSSLFHINLLQEYLALFKNLSWENIHDERINTPGTALPINWTYRFRPSIEEIITDPKLKKAMKKLIEE